MSGALQATFMNQRSFTTVPDAPTIGTATVNTITTLATVAFTAPANNGGATITSYTATSSPAGGTGTLNQAGSGTIEIRGLTAGITYTFTVRATNSVGASAPSSASNSITAVRTVGDAFGGGFFAGQISTTGNGIATHNLVVAPLSTGEFTGLWKTTNTDTIGTDSVIDGIANMAAMIAAGAADHPCGNFCNNLVTGGFSDWYMPARNELEVCYFNLKPLVFNNDTTAGINPNAVPARASNYTLSNPALTISLEFRNGGAQAFNFAVSYWSSTQGSSGIAGKMQSFVNGFQFDGLKNTTNTNVRAIRRVPV